MSIKSIASPIFTGTYALIHTLAPPISAIIMAITARKVAITALALGGPHASITAPLLFTASIISTTLAMLYILDCALRANLPDKSWANNMFMTKRNLRQLKAKG